MTRHVQTLKSLGVAKGEDFTVANYVPSWSYTPTAAIFVAIGDTTWAVSAYEPDHWVAEQVDDMQPVPASAVVPCRLDSDLDPVQMIRENKELPSFLSPTESIPTRKPDWTIEL